MAQPQPQQQQQQEAGDDERQQSTTAAEPSSTAAAAAATAAAAAAAVRLSPTPEDLELDPPEVFEEFIEHGARKSRFIYYLFFKFSKKN